MVIENVGGDREHRTGDGAQQVTAAGLADSGDQHREGPEFDIVEPLVEEDQCLSQDNRQHA